MKNKTILYFLIILNSLTLFSCNKGSDISALNSRINELTDVLEQHQERKIKNYLAKDFLTSKSASKPQFILFARYHFKRNKNISVVITNKQVIKNNKGFDVIFRVLLLGSNHLFPDKGQMYNVDSRWKKESGKWVISRLRWEKI